MATRKTRARARPRTRKAPAAPKRTRDGGPQGWPTLAPYLTVRDAGRSLQFYKDAFGFKVAGEVMKDKNGAVMHAGMMLGEAAIMFAPRGMSDTMQPPAASGAPDSLSLYLYVPDVDKLAARAVRAGAALLQSPADQFWGDRIAILKDPDGYHWTFATNVGAFDPDQAPQ